MMTFKTLFAAAILSIAPTFVLAMGCSGYAPEQTAMSCADGLVLDAATGTCVAKITS